jgi:hypothetical protein
VASPICGPGSYSLIEHFNYQQNDDPIHVTQSPSKPVHLKPPAAKASVGLGGARAAGFLVLAAIAIGPLGMRGWGTTARFGKVLVRFV